MSANLTRSPSGPATWPWWPPSHRPPPSNDVSFAGVAVQHPPLALAVLPLAAAVGYSRVNLRVHYPFDVLAGAAIGAGMGLVSGPVIRTARRWWDSMTPVPESERPSTTQLILVVSPSAGHHAGLVRARKGMTAMGLQVATEIPVTNAKLLPRLLAGH